MGASSILSVQGFILHIIVLLVMFFPSRDIGLIGPGNRGFAEEVLKKHKIFRKAGKASGNK